MSYEEICNDIAYPNLQRFLKEYADRMSYIRLEREIRNTYGADTEQILTEA